MRYLSSVTTLRSWPQPAIFENGQRGSGLPLAEEIADPIAGMNDAAEVGVGMAAVASEPWIRS
jgi:hypothetical protein